MTKVFAIALFLLCHCHVPDNKKLAEELAHVDSLARALDSAANWPLQGPLQDTVIPELIYASMEIMQILDIEIRDSLKFDGKMRVMVNRAAEGDLAQFIREDIRASMSNEKIKDTYRNPAISIGKYSCQAIVDRKAEALYSRSLIVHELCHYLQTTRERIDRIQKANLTYIEYTTEPDEFEASAVQSYFYVKEVNPDKINYLKSIPVKDRREYFELLVDVFNKWKFNRIVFGRYLIDYN